MPTLLQLPKSRWFYTLLFLVIAATAWFTAQWWLGVEVPAETVVRRDFVQTVVASGHVESPHRIDIASQLTATVNKIYVQEGQTVKANAVLIELAAADLQASARQAELAVLQAKARLRQLTEVQAPVAEQNLRQAQLNWDNARTAFSRNEDLFKKGFIGQAVLDDSRKVRDIAQAQLQSAQKQMETTRSTGSDFAIASGAVRESEAAASVAQAKAQYAVIRAPVAGLLISRSVEVGDVVQPGKVLMGLSPAGKTQIVLAIDEKNLRLIAVGQKALVSADAYPQQPFEAVVTYINPGVNAQTGTVGVKLDVSKVPSFLLQDMTVSVDIEVARRPKALLLPSAAIHNAEGSAPAPWVMQIVEGSLVKTPVHIGLRSGGFVEIVDGVAEGDNVVATATATTPAAGTRVQMKKKNHADKLAPV